MRVRLKEDQVDPGRGLPSSLVVARRALEATPLEHRIWHLLSNSWLVPVPRSGIAPAREEWVWPAARIAGALSDLGVGRGVGFLLERTTAVTRSSTASSAAERPGLATHFHSLSATPAQPLGSSTALCLLDDVVTRGTTLMAAAARLREAYPETAVFGVAMFRTLAGVEFLPRFHDPVVGQISAAGERVVRRP